MSLENINIIRKQQKISLDDLSKLSGVPKGTLSKITAGITKNPNLETVKAIANALNCTLEELDSENNNVISEYTDTEKDIIKNYRLLDERGKTVVLDVLIRELQYSGKQQIEATEIINTLKGLAAEVQILNLRQSHRKK